MKVLILEDEPLIAQGLALKGGLFPVGLYLSVAGVLSLVALVWAKGRTTG